ncbi:MAG: glycosyltransferase family 4 protein [Clostridia bacterium]|nr:glycosyltransferase family 4 protein [Clostridia bacterium]
MNVVHLQLFGYIGGMQTICREIYLESKNNNYFYFLFEGGPISDQIEQMGGKVIIEHAPHQFFFKSLIKFIKFCKDEKIDVVICHAGSPIAWIHMIVASYFLKNVRFAVYEHGDIIDMIGAGGLRTTLLKPIMKKAIKRADFVVSVSEFVKRRNKEILGISTDKAHVVYNGIRPELFHRDNIESHDTFRLVYVGRIFRKKGLHLLVDAAAKLPCDMNYTIDIIGEGEDVPMLVEKTKEYGLEDKINFRGPQTNVAEWLKQMDLFVHPAIWEEGFGITLVEAMAASIPCVAFKKGALPELINNGENGFIAEEVSAEALCEKIVECYKLFKNGSYDKLREGARATGDSFSIANTVEQLEKLY